MSVGATTLRFERLRWNSEGHEVVYTSNSDALAILEVAVHKKFTYLHTVPHVITHARVLNDGSLHIVRPSDIPNPHWLLPGSTSRDQQTFGDELVERYGIVALPSIVAPPSWNVSSRSGRGQEHDARRADALGPRSPLDPVPA